MISKGRPFRAAALPRTLYKRLDFDVLCMLIRLPYSFFPFFVEKLISLANENKAFLNVPDFEFLNVLKLFGERCH